MKLTKKKTFLLIVTSMFIYAQDNINLKKPSSSRAEIKQIYRFQNVPDDGSYSIIINNISVNLKFTGHEGSGAKLTVTSIGYGIREQDTEEIHNFTKRSVKHFEQEKKIIFSGNKKSTNFFDSTYDFEVPKHINLNIQIPGGDIDIKNINGESAIESEGGDLSIQNYNGNIDSKVNGGKVNVTSSKGSLRAHSFGGNIDITQFKGKLGLSSTGGSINLNQIDAETDAQTTAGEINFFDTKGDNIILRASGGSVKGEKVSGNISLKSSGGNIDVSNLNGKINLFSSGGSIFVNDLNGELTCEASSGDIKMTKIRAKVESLTSSGNVMLQLMYDSALKDYGVHLETYGGDAEIILPEGLAGNIIGTIYQRNSEKNIHSEIPLNITSNQNSVTGKVNIKGGLVPINIEVYKGSIIIKQT